jgi:hypothetical protein
LSENEFIYIYPVLDKPEKELDKLLRQETTSPPRMKGKSTSKSLGLFTSSNYEGFI